MYKRQPNGHAHKVEFMQLIHNTAACIIRQTVAKVFKIADLFQGSTTYNKFCSCGISSTLVLGVDICNAVFADSI